jgi:hypothetical protein
MNRPQKLGPKTITCARRLGTRAAVATGRRFARELARRLRACCCLCRCCGCGGA